MALPAEPLPAPAADLSDPALLPLLHEIREALQALLDEGRESTIDLRAMPLSPSAETQLETALGRGEVEARVEAAGPSTVRETAYPGVWLVEHADPTGRIVAKLIEIAWIPAFLMSQPADARHGLALLSERLTAGDIGTIRDT